MNPRPGETSWSGALFNLVIAVALLALFVTVARVAAELRVSTSAQEATAEAKKKEMEAKEALRIPVKDRGYKSGHGTLYSFSPEPGVTCYTVTRSSQSMALDCVASPIPKTAGE